MYIVWLEGFIIWFNIDSTLGYNNRHLIGTIWFYRLLIFPVSDEGKYFPRDFMIWTWKLNIYETVSTIPIFLLEITTKSDHNMSEQETLIVN